MSHSSDSTLWRRLQEDCLWSWSERWRPSSLWSHFHSSRRTWRGKVVTSPSSIRFFVYIWRRAEKRNGGGYGDWNGWQKPSLNELSSGIATLLGQSLYENGLNWTITLLLSLALLAFINDRSLAYLTHSLQWILSRHFAHTLTALIQMFQRRLLSHFVMQQQAEFGALFCDFYCESRLDRACCYFLSKLFVSLFGCDDWLMVSSDADTKGVRVDQFTLIVDAS